jgi:hypothetical protein
VRGQRLPDGERARDRREPRVDRDVRGHEVVLDVLRGEHLLVERDLVDLAGERAGERARAVPADDERPARGRRRTAAVVHGLGEVAVDVDAHLRRIPRHRHLSRSRWGA